MIGKGSQVVPGGISADDFYYSAQQHESKNQKPVQYRHYPVFLAQEYCQETAFKQEQVPLVTQEYLAAIKTGEIEQESQYQAGPGCAINSN